MKRTVFHLTWNKTYRSWDLRSKGKLVDTNEHKMNAVAKAVGKCRLLWKDRKRAQLIVHKKSGVIEYERTYGRDPRRSKG